MYEDDEAPVALTSSAVAAAGAAGAADVEDSAAADRAASDSPADAALLLARPPVRRLVPLQHFAVVLGRVSLVA